MAQSLSKGRKLKVGDQLNEIEQIVLKQALEELKPSLLGRWQFHRAIKANKWAELLNDLCHADQEKVRQYLVNIAKTDPTLGAFACSVGRAFSSATKIQWTTGKELQ